MTNQHSEGSTTHREARESLKLCAPHAHVGLSQLHGELEGVPPEEHGVGEPSLSVRHHVEGRTVTTSQHTVLRPLVGAWGTWAN